MYITALQIPWPKLVPRVHVLRELPLPPTSPSSSTSIRRHDYTVYSHQLGCGLRRVNSGSMPNTYCASRSRYPSPLLQSSRSRKVSRGALNHSECCYLSKMPVKQALPLHRHESALPRPGPSSSGLLPRTTSRKHHGPYPQNPGHRGPASHHSRSLDPQHPSHPAGACNQEHHGQAGAGSHRFLALYRSLGQKESIDYTAREGIRRREG